MEFDFHLGSCAVANGEIYLCFSFFQENVCRRTKDLISFEMIETSKVGHCRGSLAATSSKS